MKALKVAALGVLLTGWLTAVAWSQITLPKGLEGVVPHYPEAKVIFCQRKEK